MAKVASGVGTALLLAAFGSAASAAPPAIFGYSTERQPGRGCIVKMTLDESAFVQAIPQLKELGLLNPEYVTQTRVNVMPMTITMVYVMQMAPTTIKNTFEDDAKLSSCEFKQVVNRTDDFGKDVEQAMFTFRMTRAVEQKINWDKFQSFNLPKIAPVFTLDPSFIGEVATEKRGDDE